MLNTCICNKYVVSHKMQFNVKKSQVMFFLCKKNKYPKANLYLNKQFVMSKVDIKVTLTNNLVLRLMILQESLKPLCYTSCLVPGAICQEFVTVNLVSLLNVVIVTWNQLKEVTVI